MSILNAVLRVIFDTLLYPFRELPPIVGLAVVSLLAAVAMLLVFKKTSNQGAMADVKRRLHAGFFEIRLFNDDVRAILRAQSEMLRQSLTYMRLSTIPMLWMIVPLALVTNQLQFHYGYRGLALGETALLKVELEEVPIEFEKPTIALHAPQGLRVRTPSVWIPSLRQMAWRVVADREGDYEIEVQLNGDRFAKTVTVSNAVVRCSPVRPSSHLLAQLVDPAEHSLPEGSPIRSIRLNYPERELSLGVFGWKTHWLVIFFVLSILFAFLLRKRFGVTI